METIFLLSLICTYFWSAYVVMSVLSVVHGWRYGASPEVGAPRTSEVEVEFHALPAGGDRGDTILGTPGTPGTDPLDQPFLTAKTPLLLPENFFLVLQYVGLHHGPRTPVWIRIPHTALTWASVILMTVLLMWTVFPNKGLYEALGYTLSYFFNIVNIMQIHLFLRRLARHSWSIVRVFPVPEDSPRTYQALRRTVNIMVIIWLTFWLLMFYPSGVAFNDGAGEGEKTFVSKHRTLTSIMFILSFNLFSAWYFVLIIPYITLVRLMLLYVTSITKAAHPLGNDWDPLGLELRENLVSRFVEQYILLKEFIHKMQNYLSLLIGPCVVINTVAGLIFIFSVLFIHPNLQAVMGTFYAVANQTVTFVGASLVTQRLEEMVSALSTYSVRQARGKLHKRMDAVVRDAMIHTRSMRFMGMEVSWAVSLKLLSVWVTITSLAGRIFAYL